MNLGNWMGSEHPVQGFACWAVEFGLSAHEGTVSVFLMHMKWLLALSDAGSWVASWRERQACSFGMLARATATKPFHGRSTGTGFLMSLESGVSGECAGRGTVPLKLSGNVLFPASPSFQQEPDL